MKGSKYDQLIFHLHPTNLLYLKGGGRGGFNNYGGDSDKQDDTVFITGLPEEVTEIQISDYFGSIGIIKVCS